MLNTALQILHADLGSIGLYIEKPIAIQEIEMGLWLVIAGFNKKAVKKLDDSV